MSEVEIYIYKPVLNPVFMLLVIMNKSLNFYAVLRNLNEIVRS
jgi:hypothetical protein